MRPILGGVIAAAIGAGVVLYLLPQGWQPPAGADLSSVETRLAALEDQPAPEIPPPFDPAELEARLTALESALAAREPGDHAEAPATVDLEPLESRIVALERAAAAENGGAESAASDLAPLAERISALEARPEIDAGALAARITALEEVEPVDLAGLNRRIAALEADLPGLVSAAVEASTAEAYAALAAQAETVAASADDVARAQARAEALAALGDLGLAADTGAPAPDALAELAAATDLPEGIAAFADGVPTLSALQAGFPAAARAALAAAPLPEDAGAGDRLRSFLRNQTGARSLTPRAGDDPDAVLSRAEAALRAGDLAGTLDEIAALPPASASALQAWQQQAETRIAALAALSELSARLGQDQEPR